MSPTLSFATFIPSQKKQAGGVPRKNQPGLRAVQKISLSWLFSFTESPGGTSASGLWGGSAQKGVWGAKSKEGLGGESQEALPWAGRDGGHSTGHGQLLLGDTPHATNRTYFNAASKGVRSVDCSPLTKWGCWGILLVGSREMGGLQRASCPGEGSRTEEGCGVSRGYDIPHGLGQRRPCAARPHLCEGLLEEKEGAAVGQSNLKTPQKPGCDTRQSRLLAPLPCSLSEGLAEV